MALRKSTAQEYLTTQPKQQYNCGGELQGPSESVESAISHCLFGSPWVTARGLRDLGVWRSASGCPYAGCPPRELRSRGSQGHLRGPCETGRLWVGEGQADQLPRPGAASTGPSLTLAAAAGRCPAATEPAQRRPAALVRRGGGGQARKHPGGAEAPTRTPPPASEPPAAPTDSIDRTPADTKVCAAARGLRDPEVATAEVTKDASWGRGFRPAPVSTPCPLPSVIGVRKFVSRPGGTVVF